MTLISSWGGPGSNSYPSLTEANSFITTGILDHEAWDAATQQRREAALIEATRSVDSRQYIGVRYNYDQVLEFPRQMSFAFPWNRTNTSSTVFSTTHARMEADVKKAVCEQALFLLRNGGRDFHAENRAAGITEYTETTGPVHEKVVYSGRGANAGGLCQSALSYLSEWLTSRRVVRG